MTSTPHTRSPAVTGFMAAVAAFLIWGILNPLYFKTVAFVGALEIVSHRVVWTAAFLAVWALATVGFGGVLRAVGSWRRLGIFALTTALITANWSIFIWAVIENRLLESSLGYYINPLINVLLGVAVLGERLSGRQSAAVALAGVGVLVLVIAHGALPWVSLALAVSFGLYTLARKRVAIDPMIGLLVETALLLPLGLGYLLWLGADNVFLNAGLRTDLLIVLAGPITAAPLVLFVVGAQRLRLSTIGLLQYIGPTGQLLIGVLVYGEAFTPVHALAFGFIWLALVVFSADAWWSHRSREHAPAE